MLVCGGVALLQVLQVSRGPLVALSLRTGTWSCKSLGAPAGKVLDCRPDLEASYFGAGSELWWK